MSGHRLGFVLLCICAVTTYAVCGCDIAWTPFKKASCTNAALNERGVELTSHTRRPTLLLCSIRWPGNNEVDPHYNASLWVMLWKLLDHRGLVWWRGENLMKWQCTWPAESNVKFVFGNKLEWGVLPQDVGRGHVLFCALLTATGDLYQARMTVRPQRDQKNNRLFLNVSLLFTQAGLVKHTGCFSERPHSAPFHFHTFTPQRANVSPAWLTELFLLTSRVLTALLQVTSTKVTRGICRRDFYALWWYF